MSKNRFDVLVLRGGLGNQLFQIAFAHEIHIRYGRNFVFRWFKEDDVMHLFSVMDYQLNRSHHVLDFLDGEMRKSVPLFVRGVSRAFHLLFAAFLRYRILNIRELTDPKIFKTTKRLVLDGFYQERDLSQEGQGFVISEILKKIEQTCNTLEPTKCALHLRYGDYIPIGWKLAISYYVRCLDSIDPAIPITVIAETNNDIDSFIHQMRALGFSNRDFLPKYDSDVMSDLQTLVTSEILVTANSTFSYWAGIVGDQYAELRKKRRQVFTPQIWLPGNEVNSISPDHWTRITNEFESNLI